MVTPFTGSFAACILTVVLLCIPLSSATTLQVGADKAYRSVNDALRMAAEADEIVVDPNYITQQILFTAEFSGASVTVRGHNATVAANTTVSLVNFMNTIALDRVAFMDLMFVGTVAGRGVSYDQSIITSSITNPTGVKDLYLERCIFDQGTARGIGIWMPILTSNLTIMGGFCTNLSLLIGASLGSGDRPDENWNGRAQFISVHGMGFSPDGCTINIPASTRLVRGAATLQSNFLLQEDRTEVQVRSSRQCHSLQGYRRVEYTGNIFALNASTVSGWRHSLCFHLKGSRFLLAGNNLASVKLIRIFADAAVTFLNNSMALSTTEYPLVSPDVGCSKSNLNLQQNWWGFTDGPRLTQYNGTWRESYFPWYTASDFSSLAQDCASDCRFHCDYIQGQCNKLALDGLTIAAIATTSSLLALFLAVVFLYPYARWLCCRPAEFV